MAGVGLRVSLALLLILQLATTAEAERKRFNAPQYNGYRLDWCLNWGSGCGRDAANAWCKTQGFADGAIQFQQAPDIGASTPTRLIGTGAICDQPFCDGFKLITCSRPDLRTFNNPMQGTNRLDWCYDWGTGCGAQAANAWCRAKGFSSASAYAEAPDIGAQEPTRLISTGAVCDQSFCDGFRYITCKP